MRYNEILSCALNERVLGCVHHLPLVDGPFIRFAEPSLVRLLFAIAGEQRAII